MIDATLTTESSTVIRHFPLDVLMDAEDGYHALCALRDIFAFPVDNQEYGCMAMLLELIIDKLKPAVDLM